MITHVAIMQDNKVWKLPSPNRHHHIIKMIYKKTGAVMKPDAIQGFLTTHNMFLDRKQAKQYAINHNQIKKGMGKHDDLYSEDLW